MLAKHERSAAAIAPQPCDDSHALLQKHGQSKNHAKNEAKRRAKMDKFLAKQAKLQGAGAVGKPATPTERVRVYKGADTGAQSEATTPLGEKKNMSLPMSATYSPREVESAWGAWWQKQGFFRPQMHADGSISGKGTYVVSLPPPNVVGPLQLDHVLAVSTQDILARWNRMLGKTVLYAPGCDYAKFATDSREMKGSAVVIERGTPTVLSGAQLRQLGASVDWDRARSASGDSISAAVREAFVRLHGAGTIFRANRLVNWCSALRTAVSSLEVEPCALKGRTLLPVPGYDRKIEFGVLTVFAYPLEGGGRIVLATTRIETTFGDAAICVHPRDPRYANLIGRRVLHPFVTDRDVRIIGDDMVDMEFGTGACKITPAHDSDDYAVALRHGLPFTDVFTDDGRMSAAAGPEYAGMKRYDARAKVIAALKVKGMFIEFRESAMVVPMCAQSADILEPRVKPLWWVNCKEMAGMATAAVRSGQLDLTPRQLQHDWLQGFENVQDWCISRQLASGHRIPAYFVRLNGQSADSFDDKYWVSGKDEAEALKSAKNRFPSATFTLEQDSDVLDTWFTSALWPFSALGWPNQTEDLDRFYPMSLLETSRDALFIWVARMVMMGIKLTNAVPFTKVICHSLIRDAQGTKMSKSQDNATDPLDLIQGVPLTEMNQRLDKGGLDSREIEKAKAGQVPECGADALRLGLCASTSSNRDINFDIKRIEGHRKFCNKVWNATRFVLGKLPADFKMPADRGILADPTTLSLPEQWILARLNRAAQDATAGFEALNFMAATAAMQQFWTNDLCDVFIEACKALDTGSVHFTLAHCLDAGLRMLHPLMPFITEELWHRLPRAEGHPESIVIAPYPEHDTKWEMLLKNAEHDFNPTLDAVRLARSAMTESRVCKSHIYIATTDSAVRSSLESSKDIITSLIKCAKKLSIMEELPTFCTITKLHESLAIGLMDANQAPGRTNGELH